ncbi:hypothetical protein NVS55_37590 [Myxococcus stipitatus]|uniref:hypothetical protein n=1 Tax=Myxococcus stipitatus TaxID=83455 RepID=UPI003144E4E9
MRKALFLGALALGAVACDPDIKQDPAPGAGDVGLAEFDPSATPAIVPSPNDLAIGKLPDGTNIVQAPINPSAPAAEQEFTREYLNTLNGFPTSVIATTLVKDLDPATVNANTVKFIDVYEDVSVLARPATPTFGYREATGHITVIPPQPQGWPKGGRYAVAIIGGENGVKTKSGKPVIGSATWAFASSREKLVTCDDLTAPDCAPTTELIPSTETDPAKRLADQTRSALRLEQLRRGYSPILDKMSAKFGVNRDDIVVAWTFTIMSRPEATFDITSATPIVPFPNDLLRDPKTGKLALPVPAEPPLLRNFLSDLNNNVDGWSTTAPIITENSATRGVIDNDLQLDMNTVELGKQLLFLKLTPGGNQPQVKICLNCASSPKANGSAADKAPEQLQIIPQVPLDPGSQYAVVLLRGPKELKNAQPVFPTASQALLRLKNPVFANGKSQVSAVPDTSAPTLEAARAAMAPLYDMLEARLNIERKDVLMAWTFTTQSTRTKLAQLNAAPAASGTSDKPLYLVDQTTNLAALMAANGLDGTHIGHWLVGGYKSPFYLDDATGAYNATRAKHEDHIPFWMFLPTQAPDAGGYKTVVFGHGLTGNRTNVLAIANKLNEAGYAVVAIDTVYHGERTSCAGITPQSGLGAIDSPDKACATGSTCDVTPGSATFGRCVAPAAANSCDPANNGDLVCNAAGQGVCLDTGKCEGGDFRRGSNGAPVVSGWNFLNLGSLGATRDNFRHHVVDFAQLTRVLASDDMRTRIGNLAGGRTINAATVDYVGQSLGGMQGVLSAAVSERTRRTALNVPGGDLVDILLTAEDPTLSAQRAGFMQLLGSLGRAPGTPGFDEFIVLARTALDGAAARNYGWYLENSDKAPAERDAFIQYIKGDMVVPNPVTEGLIASANRNSTRTVQSYMVTIDPLPPEYRHAFLLISVPPTHPQYAFMKSVRDTAQDQVVSFLKTGTAVAP